MAWNRESGFRARYPGHCHVCRQSYSPGDTIYLAVAGTSRGRRGGNKYAHLTCRPSGPTTDAPPAEPPATEPPTTTDLVIDAESAAAAIEALAAAIGGPALDEERVRELVRDEIRRTAPATIEVRIPDRPPVTIDGAHHLLPRVVRLVAAGIHVYLWGPPGSGKTTLALHTAQALGRAVYLDTLDPSTFRSMVQGFLTPSGDPVHTAWSRAWCEGGIYLAEELDLAPATVQTLLNSALANGHTVFPWGSVPRHAAFGFIGTGNTPGRPTLEFPERRPMSEAFRDRLYFVYVPPDPNVEARAAGLPLTSPPARKERTCSPAEWGQYVRRVREWAGRNAPTLTITPRATILGLTALAAGETPAEVADGLIFRGADDALRQKALDAVPLP